MKRLTYLLLISILGLGCSDGQIVGTGEKKDPLDPPREGDGIQYRMTSTVKPGDESYGCRLFQVPPEGIIIRGEKVFFGSGGHHVLLYRTPYDFIPEVDEKGVSVDAQSVHDCSQGATARWKINCVVGGSESFGGDGMIGELPDGVGLILQPGAVLVMSTHYLNTTSAPLEVDSRINLYSMPEQSLVTEAGLFYMDNQMIRVPALGEASARMRCPVPTNVSFVSLQSHMHARGAGFLATVSEPREIRPETLYNTKSWQEPPVRTFDPPLSVLVGSSIEIRCDYQNAEARTVYRGLGSTDEMCQLIGPYFPKDERFERCEDTLGNPGELQIGGGTACGKDTLGCLDAARLSGLSSPKYIDCVLDSCPRIAREVSGLVSCHASGRASCAPEEARLIKATCE